MNNPPPQNIIWLHALPLFVCCLQQLVAFFKYTNPQRKGYVTVKQDDAKLCSEIRQSLHIIKDNSSNQRGRGGKSTSGGDSQSAAAQG